MTATGCCGCQNQMNILLINHYAGAPQYGMEFRPYYLAREWSREGAHVTVVAAAQSHVRSRAPQVENRWLEEHIDGIRYLWLPTPKYQGNGLGRGRNIFSVLGRLLLERRAIVNGNPPDVVIASSTYTLDIFPANRIARAFRAKLFYELHDLWPLSPMELGHMSRWHPFIQLVQRAENFACRRSDRIVSLLPKAEPHLREHGMRPDKFSYIPNGIDVEEWQREPVQIPETHRRALTWHKNAGLFLVGYAGAHGVANALGTVLGAARLLREQPVSFVLVGSGLEKEALQQRAREEGLKNVTFLPPVPKPAMPSLLSFFDALYVGLQHRPLFRFGISPNKLLDYMMSGKPVLQAIAAGNDPVAESGCGITVPPEDPSALAGATLRLMRWNPSQRLAAGARGREYVLANHDYRILARRFSELMRNEHAVEQGGELAPANVSGAVL